MHIIHDRIKTYFEVIGQPMRKVSVHMNDACGVLSTHIKTDTSINYDIIAELLTKALQPSSTTISYDTESFPRIESVYYDEKNGL